MKVRWTNDSIRLRITPSELDALLEGRAVSEALHLPGGAVWEATLRAGAGPTRLSGDAGGAMIDLAADDVDRLAAPETEGVYFQDMDGGVRYLVEKDFPCVHPRALEAMEPKTETFAAPADFAERKGVGGR